ncbi:alpha-2-macroglobulin family protein [Xinfangfangia sp. CPCC 101601]|uniref:Alpha-2-macroglobulin family protein n=1 Tax=Pseudogemmobacter lacusdianii TaxID=3069608 RepID=A0ABU0W032_9RHOB|nr:alpha-2-macroglobulin family protein [Xinfangfangia sp. CPCC 101601]MDQ2066495.1 alpha-2-macroglobulin family protein [Xinfangfangia sp. CPCC 101601]
MRSFAKAVVATVFLALPTASLAQELIPERRAAISVDTDLPGGDISSLFDTTQDACERACITNTRCEAYTFNTRNGSCFLKQGAGEAESFAGAVSGHIMVADPALVANAPTRRAELNFLSDWEFETATEMAQSLGRHHSSGPWSAEEHLASAAENEASGNWAMATAFTGAALAVADSADLWLEYSRRALAAGKIAGSDQSWYQSRAFPAAVNAYLRAGAPAQRHTILVSMALAFEAQGRGSDMVKALRLAQSLQSRADTEALLDEAIGKYGFRVSDSNVQSDLARPRICATFTDDLVPSGVDYANFVKLPAAGLFVESDGYRNLCVVGVEHGARYTVTFREGLPAKDGQSLAKSIDVTLYVRDRSPGVSFPGRGYVLPKTTEAALPVLSVNTEKLDLTLFRVTDRNILRAIQNDYFGTPIPEWSSESFTNDIGEEIWHGSAKVGQEVNKDVTTRLPLAEPLQGQPAGIYALRAEVPGVDPYTTPASWQWFVVSDLGITSMSGVDGLHVFIRSLGTAQAKPGTQVELLNRANTILATTTADEQGYARFEPGLLRGTGSAAPALVVVRDGDADLGFLSLTDPEFDLSDRGVEGREPAPPVDVFLTTDRGAYRVGETVFATALARDSLADAVEGLPLTAILMRPDGVEYSRQLVEDKGAGGHVFALPIAGAAPRGVWTLKVFADLEAAALTQKTFLVEDFLPERIDFTLALGDTPLSLSGPRATLDIDARYLFGAPGADLAIEGETLLRQALGLKAYPGYQFGRHDDAFAARMEPLFAENTDAEGKASVEVTLPELSDPGRPLEARIAVRVAEGSGRPVERRLTVELAPSAAMIGIKPLFEDVAPEGTDARFSVIGIGKDSQPAPMQVQWKLNRVQTDYQWFQSYGDWNWERVTYRTLEAEGEAQLGQDPLEISAPVKWGEYELVVTRADGEIAASSVRFWAGWYAPAEVTSTPDTLELSLDKEAYTPGETAQLRVVPRAAGTALVTVLSNRLIAMQTVEVKEGENLISLPVTEEWGAGAYVTVSALRPMDEAAGRNPARALGLSYAAVDPGAKALKTTIEMAAESAPRAPLEVAVKVEGVAAGETAYVTLAAVDVGILNLTGFQAPDPKGHYFGQRKLGIGIHDVYGRLIDGLNGATGEVRSGGDAGAQAALNAPPPTEELVAYFTGPLTVGADGYARTSFDLPAFNGSVKVMAVAWSKSGIGQADQEVLVRDPVVVTASLPRFLSPGDESRLLLEVVHATGPSGRMSLDIIGNGVTLGAVPSGFELGDLAKQVFEIPVKAEGVGLQTIDVNLTTPDGKTLKKTLNLPVQVNDPEIAKVSRLELKKGQSFTFDQAVFADMIPGSGKSVMAIGPLARLNAPGLLAALDRYPYGCTEQITSRALPLLYFDELAQVMDLKGADNIQKRIDEAVVEILSNQGSEGGFGLWSAGSGDMWLDAYVTDFLSRAKAQGYMVPELALKNALSNLRNQVNYAPDFDDNSNGGGTALAYALMVLAREGAAAIGDLRYYADVKADSFATPLAQAQLGAALASYGDQPRADAMFRKAGAKMAETARQAEGQVWRADYGTHYRDAAALLTLAVESGSTAVDVEALADQIASTSVNRSTQEATWALMAANALIDRPDSTGIQIDGAPATGPLVKVLTDGQAPVQITNEGPDTTITLTTYGVPAEPEPAGGNGYAITRSHFTLTGEPVTLDQVTAGDRLVTVIEVTPFERSEGRLIIADPLPAGFEIDNPNLISAGATANLDWLDALSEVTHSEFRQDRFITALDWTSASSFRLAYVVRAVSPGTFHHPAASVEDMYRPDYRARTDAGSVTITAK